MKKIFLPLLVLSLFSSVKATIGQNLETLGKGSLSFVCAVPVIPSLIGSGIAGKLLVETTQLEDQIGLGVIAGGLLFTSYGLLKFSNKVANSLSLEENRKKVHMLKDAGFTLGSLASAMAAGLYLNDKYQYIPLR